MKIEAHLNGNLDLLVTFSDRTSEMEDLCVGIQKEWMDSKSEFYLSDWKSRITGKFSSHAGRDLTESEAESLDSLIGSAVMTDGISPKD